MSTSRVDVVSMESKKDERNDHDVAHLPDHSVAMRQAADYCIRLAETILQKTEQPLSWTTKQALEDAVELARCTPQRRKEAQDNFWAHLDDKAAFPQIHWVDELTTCNSSRSSSRELDSSSSPILFRKQFQHPNLPCLISGLDRTQFSNVAQQWTVVTEDGDGNQRNTINHEWFVDKLGGDAIVPLRVSSPLPSNSDLGHTGEKDDSGLDKDGRATECETRHVTLDEWIERLEQPSLRDSALYLKDWHLQLKLESMQQEKDNMEGQSFHSLYQCPEIFQFDLLNSFLTRFCKGDYRFCYWGPLQSYTGQHSDVLYSFSWSYNVVGTKKWTFYAPKRSDVPEDAESPRTVTLVQSAGQAILVPCTWEHDVVNMEETISINHNWITTASLDLTWQCLQTEMEAIEPELASWGIENSLDACESMLRGCVGLDVTAYFLMVAVRWLDLLDASSTRIAAANNAEEDKELLFDIVRLSRTIGMLLETESVKLRERLSAVLHSEAIADTLWGDTQKVWFSTQTWTE